MQTEAKRPDYGTIVVSAIFILLGDRKSVV